MFKNNQELAERSYRRERKEREEDLERMRRDHDYAALIRAIGEETERIFNDFPTAGHREQLGQVLGVGEGPTPCFGDLRLRPPIDLPRKLLQSDCHEIRSEIDAPNILSVTS
jgi:hypothetical protein